MTLHKIEARGLRIGVDDTAGHLALFELDTGARTIAPLHRAPWVDDPDQHFPDGTPQNVRRLSGDFFCAPFGRNDVENGPSHGAPANSPWELIEAHSGQGGASIGLRLQATVMGATLTKTLRLVDGHPFVYQEHVFEGGRGAISAAHHVMVAMQDGGTLAVSAKRHASTPPDPLESDPARGRSILSYPARSADLSAFPLASGGSTDLTRFPPGEAHEDFVTLSEAAGNEIGWTVVSRAKEADRVMVLKNPAVLPVTMLWMSNGGRHYAPWSSRHRGVLGIEDGRASPMGHRASVSANAMTAEGIATAFDLGGRVTVRQVLGACEALFGEGPVTDLTVAPGVLNLDFADGRRRGFDFDDEFLASPAPGPA